MTSWKDLWNPEWHGRIAWPAYTNEVVFLFHATALIYFTLPVIGDQKDLMNMAGDLYERDYNVFLHFGVAALYFLRNVWKLLGGYDPSVLKKLLAVAHKQDVRDWVTGLAASAA